MNIPIHEHPNYYYLWNKIYIYRYLFFLLSYYFIIIHLILFKHINHNYYSFLSITITIFLPLSPLSSTTHHRLLFRSSFEINNFFSPWHWGRSEIVPTCPHCWFALASSCRTGNRQIVAFCSNGILHLCLTYITKRRRYGYEVRLFLPFDPSQIFFSFPLYVAYSELVEK